MGNQKDNLLDTFQSKLNDFVYASIGSQAKVTADPDIADFHYVCIETRNDKRAK